MGAREEFMAIHRATKQLESRTDLDDLDAAILELFREVCLPEVRFIRLGARSQYIIGTLAYTTLGKRRPDKDAVPEYDRHATEGGKRGA